MTLANALTGIRAALSVPFAGLLLSASRDAAWLAAALLATAIVTDLLDGPLARRAAASSERGRLLDHGADFAFVLGGLAVLAWRGLVPMALPALVVLAFGLYTREEWGPRSASSRRPSRLGRWNGVLYFAPLAVGVAYDLGLSAAGPLLRGLGWGLVASTLVALMERAHRAWLARRTARGSLAAGTRARSPRS